MKLKRRSANRGKAAAHPAISHFGRAVVKAAPVVAVLLILFAAIAVFDRIGPGITGFVVFEKTFTTTLSKDITAAAEKTTTEIPVTLEAAPNSLSISGKLVGQGTAKAYLLLNGQKYLILDTSQLKTQEAAATEGLLAVTGRIVEEAQEQAQTITAAVVDVLVVGNETALAIANEKNTTAAINETAAVNQSSGSGETTNQTAANETQQPQQANKTITAVLQYNSGTAFDADDNGIETEKGAVDLTVASAEFSWQPVDEGKLCTRWKVDSFDTGTTAVVCNGNENCCSLVELSPKAESWKEPFHVFYGGLSGAVGYGNNVSSQVIYADYSLETAEAEVDVAYSGWQTLQAKFLPTTEFKAACLETCKLPKLEFNRSLNATIIVELENAEATTTLTLDSVTYTAAVSVNTAPQYTAMPAIRVKKNSASTVNLSQYFIDADGDSLTFSAASDNDNVMASVARSEIAVVEPKRDFAGNATAEFTATDGVFTTSSGKVKITVTGEKANSPPQLLEEIENVTITKGKSEQLNLAEHFSDPDGDALTYEAYKADNITISIDSAAATITPYKGWVGKRHSYITAADKENATAVSNVFAIEVPEAAAAEKEETEEVIERIEINKPVKWHKTIRLAKESNTTTEIPAAAANITVKKNNASIEDNVRVKEAGKAEKRLKDHLQEKKAKEKAAAGENLTLAIEENATRIEVEYETPAPAATETELSNFRKQILVSSDFHYENVTAYTTLTTQAPASAVKLYWLKKAKKQAVSSEVKLSTGTVTEATGAEEEEFETVKVLVEDAVKIDTDGDGLIDRLEWVIPSLSNQTYEVEITILNVQSYPTVGGNWTVAFNTTGTANLTITALNGTSYAETPVDNASTTNDLEFLELRCGQTITTPTLVKDSSNRLVSVFSENWICDNQTAYHTVKVLTEGVHTQEFNFSDQTAYAFNTAANDVCDTGDDQGTCTITSAKGVTNGSILNFTHLVIANGGQLFNDTATAFFYINATNITIQNGGKITGNVNVTAVNLTIEQGGLINATEKGYAGSTTNSAAGKGSGGGGGATGTGGGGGGGHGGRGGAGGSVNGGNGGTAYNSITAPTELGSGGGGSSAAGSGYGLGGGGGGAIFINVTLLENNGTIMANGASGTSGCGSCGEGGSGSGGSIYINATTFSGNGSITANGAAGGSGSYRYGGGGGGGGRIAIYYSTKTFGGILDSTGGTAGTGPSGNGNGAGAGTIYVKKSGTNGDLIIDNNDIAGTSTPINSTFLAANSNLDNLNITRKATVQINASYNATNVNISGTSAVTIKDGENLNATNFYLQTSSTITNNGNLITSNLNISTSASLTSNGNLTITTLNLQSSSTMTNNANLTVTTLNLQSSSTFTNNRNVNITTTYSTETSTSITNNGTITFPSPTLFINNTFTNKGSWSVTEGGLITELVINGTLTQDTYLNLSNITIKSGGTLTHSANSASKTYWLNITAVNLTIQAGGGINVTEKGYAGGGTSANGNGPGGGKAGAANEGGAGGGHGGNGGNGGLGATGGTAYNSITEPTNLGSGGGGGNNQPAGSGGGAIFLNVSDTLTVDGNITAIGKKGGAGVSSSTISASGGGASGSIYIITRNFSGSGLINASGGRGGDDNDGTDNGGGGAGGRIAIYYTTKTYTGSIIAAGGIGNQNAGAGTIYVKKSGTNGDLIMDNNNVEAGAVTPINSTLLASGSTLDNLNISKKAVVHINSSYNATTVNISSTATVIIAGETFNATNFYLQSSSTMTNNANLTVTTLNLQSSSTFTNNRNVNITTTYSTETSTSITNNGTITFPSPTLFINNTFTNKGSWSVTEGGLITELVINGTLTQDTYLNLSNITIKSGGTLTHSANSASKTYWLNVTAANITIEPGGLIDVTGKGYAGNTTANTNGSGPGGGDGCGIDGTCGSAGGGYGGSGGNGVNGPTNNGGRPYGSITQPTDLGSAGGPTYSQTIAGGSGGGAVILNLTGTLNITGKIIANGTGGDANGGTSSVYGSGGGSGGSVHIRADTLSGNGTIGASGGKGGDDTTGDGGGGSGGRIAIYFTYNQTFTGTIQALGNKASGGNAGQNGTVLIVNNLTGITESLNTTSTGPSRSIKVNGTVLANNVTLDNTGLGSSAWANVTIYVGSTQPGNATSNGSLVYELNFTGHSTDGTYPINATFVTQTSSVTLTVDSTAPQVNISNNGSTTTTVNGVVNWTGNFTDNSALGSYIFGFNDSGSFANDSSVAISGTSRLTNVTKTITATKGKNVCGAFYVQDSAGNVNNSPYNCFDVANSPPTATFEYPASNLIAYGSNLSLNASATDADLDSITFYWHTNGTFNKTTTTNTTINLSRGSYAANVSAYDGTAFTANITVNFTISNNNVSTHHGIQFVNYSGHNFSASAAFMDPDGFADIANRTITTTAGTCNYITNTSSGNLLNLTYNCTGTALTATTVTVIVNDTRQNMTKTAATNTYPNQAPTQNHDLQFVNHTSQHSFNVSFAVDDNDNSSEVAFRNISTSSGACSYRTNTTSGTLFNVTYNCTGTALTATTVQVNISDAYSQGTTSSLLTNTYPNQAPTVSWQYPTDGLVAYGSNVTFDVTSSDADNDAITLYWYVNGTFNKTTTDDTTINLSRGNYVANVSANDGTVFTANSSVTFTISNNNVSTHHGIQFVNYTNQHSFNASAAFTDPDGFADIANRTITTTAGTCNYITNATSGNLLNLTYNCTGTALTATTVTVIVNDTRQNSTIAVATNTYPNQAPTATFEYPASNLIAYGSNLSLNASATDADLDGITFYWHTNGTFNKTTTTNTTINLSRGSYAANLSAYDGTAFTANITVNFTIENNNISAHHGIQFVNYTNQHSFNASAAFMDPDGFADIVNRTIATTAGTCNYITNATSGNLLNLTYNCTGTALTATTLTVIVNDTRQNSSKAVSANTYPNSLPTQRHDLQLVNYTNSVQFNVSYAVDDNDGAEEISFRNISATSGTCNYRSNATGGTLFNVTYNCSGTNKAAVTVQVNVSDSYGQGTQSSLISTNYPASEPTVNHHIQFVNFSSSHQFNASAAFNDIDGAADIIRRNISTSSCNYLANATSGSLFNVTYNCTGTALTTLTLHINVSDTTNDGTGTNDATNTYPNQAPTQNHDLQFVNFSSSHQFNVSYAVNDNDGFADIAIKNISVTSGACSYRTNTTSGTLFNVTYNCTGTALNNAIIQINVSDAARQGVQSSLLNNTYPNNAPSQPNITSASGLTLGGIVNITWNASNDLDSDTINYFVMVNGTQQCYTTDRNCTFTPSSDGMRLLNVTAYDSAANSTMSNNSNFTHDGNAPTFSGLANNGSTVTANNGSANWTATIDDSAGLGNYTFELNDTGTFTKNATTAASGTSQFTSFTRKINATKGKNVCGRFIANDTSGNQNTSGNSCFNVANSAAAFSPSLADQTANSGQSFYYDINCTDIDGDSITYSDNTALFAIDATTGEINDNPAESEVAANTVTITCNDGTVNKQESFIYTILDATSPTYTNLANNASTVTQTNGAVNWSVSLADGVALKTVTFSFNNSGSFANDTPVTISGASRAFNVTKTITAAAGRNVCGKFYFNDSSGNWNQTSNSCFNVKVNSNNSVPTTPTIFYPANNSYITSVPVELNVSSTDADGETITYYHFINDSLNTTSSGANSTLNASDGFYAYNAYASDGINDSANSTKVFFTLDTTRPSISYGLVVEASGLSLSRNWIFVNVTANDSNEANITFYMHNTTHLYSSVTSTAKARSNNFTSLRDGNYSYNVTIVDDSGNSNSTATRTLYLDTNPPVIGNLTVIEATNSTIVIFWNTNENSNDTVEYGANTSYGSATSNSSNASRHLTYISGLSEDTAYHYRVSSSDSVMNTNTTADKTFTIPKKTVSIVNITANQTRTINVSNTKVLIEILTLSDSTNSFVNITAGKETTVNKTITEDLNITTLKYVEIKVSGNITTALSSALLRVDYNETEISDSNISEDTLAMYRYNSSKALWGKLNSTTMGWVLDAGVNTTLNYVFANVTNFSDYGIGGLLANGKPCASNNNSCASGNCAQGFSNSNRWCAASGGCANDGTLYADGGTACNGNNLQTCGSGSWTSSSCTNGCSSGACKAAGTGGAGGGSGGGGGGGAAAKALIESLTKREDIRDLSMDTNRLAYELTAGEGTTTTLILKNDGSTDMRLKIEVKGNAEQFINVQETLTIKVKGMEKLPINIFVPFGTKEGRYNGEITITSGSEKVILPVSIKVKVPLEKEKLLDVRVQPLDTVINPGDDLKVKVDIYNLGEKGGRFDVQLLVELINAEKNQSVERSEEAIAIETSTSVLKIFKIPKDIELGKYVVKATATYSDKEGQHTATAFAQIRVQRPLIELLKPYLFKKVLFMKAWQLLLFAAFTAVMLESALKYHKARMKKRRYAVAVNVGKLPGRGARSALVGRVAETNTTAYLGVDNLTTHTIVAGATGSGKTIAAQDVVEESLEKGTAVVVFDPSAQWTGFLRKCVSGGMLARYGSFGMGQKQAKAYQGNIRQITEPRELIDVKELAEPGRITMLVLNKLTPKDIDLFVANTIRGMFLANFEESPKLKLLLVFDEVHRLLTKFGGTGDGLVQLERAAREFRKWGIGLVLISQVLTDFMGEVKANIATQIQMRTSDEGDLERLKEKYGESVSASVVRASVGTGMVENSEYNEGRAYFVSFRPIRHSVTRLTDEELGKYNRFNGRIDELTSQVGQLQQLKADVFDLEIELKLAKEKLSSGNFTMAEVYLDGLEPKVRKAWERIGKKPKAREKKLATIWEIREAVRKAKEEREKIVRKEKEKKTGFDKALLKKVLEAGGLYLVNERGANTSFELYRNSLREYGAGLCFTRTPKQAALEKYKLQKTAGAVRLITTEPVEGAYSPTSVSAIYSEIKDFVNKNGRGAIIIDGLVLITSYAGFDQAYNLLQRIKDVIAPKKFVCIISINLGALTKEQKKRLASEFSTIEGK